MERLNQAHAHKGGDMDRKQYLMLGVNLLLSAIIMYLGMFAMIWSSGEFIQNLNFVYMALVMWAPMSAVMLWTMRSMYPSGRLNALLYAVFGLAFLLSLYGIRAQALVGDREFVKSMIPHHSGAILMCSEAALKDAEIRDLCFSPRGIVESQKREIAQMKALLARLDREDDS